MPMYAGEILELVQTLLERTLERCRAAYTEVVFCLTDVCVADCEARPHMIFFTCTYEMEWQKPRK